jgi:hypothetical protein
MQEEKKKKMEWLETFKRKDQFWRLYLVYLDRKALLRHHTQRKTLLFVIRNEDFCNFGSQLPDRNRTKWTIAKKDNYKMIYNRYNLELRPVYISYDDLVRLHNMEYQYIYDLIPNANNQFEDLKKCYADFPKLYSIKENLEVQQFQHREHIHTGPRVRENIVLDSINIPRSQEFQTVIHIRYHKSPVKEKSNQNQQRLQKLLQQ